MQVRNIFRIDFYVFSFERESARVPIHYMDVGKGMKNFSCNVTSHARLVSPSSLWIVNDDRLV